MRLIAITLLMFSAALYAQKTPIIRLFSKGQNQSATYKETIAYYSLLAKDFPSIQKKWG
jgi:hypothetical protein